MINRSKMDNDELVMVKEMILSANKEAESFRREWRKLDQRTEQSKKDEVWLRFRAAEFTSIGLFKLLSENMDYENAIASLHA